MASSLDLLNRVRANLNRIDKDAEIKGWINEAKREIARRLHLDSESVSTATVTGPTPTDQPYSAIDLTTVAPRFKQEIAVLYRQTLPANVESKTKAPLPKLSEVDAHRTFALDTTGTPSAYTRNESTLRVWPGLASGDAYEITIVYRAYPSDYSTWLSTETDWFSNEADQLMVDWATHLGFGSLGEIEDAGYWRQKFEDDFRAFRALQAQRTLRGEMTLLPATGADDVKPFDPWRV